MKNLVIILGAIVAVLLLGIPFYTTREEIVNELAYSDLRREIENNNVKSVLIMGNVVRGKYLAGKEERGFATKIPVGAETAMADLMYQKGIEVRVEKESSWFGWLILVAVIVVVALLAMYVLRLLWEIISRRGGLRHRHQA